MAAAATRLVPGVERRSALVVFVDLRIYKACLCGFTHLQSFLANAREGAGKNNNENEGA